MDLGSIWTVIVDSGLKSAVLCAGGLVVAGALMRHSSAARRHVIYAGILIACLLLPMMSLLLPQWRVLPQWSTPVAQVMSSAPVVMTVAQPVAFEPMPLPLATEVPSQPAPVAVVSPAFTPEPIQPAWYTQFTLTQWLSSTWLAGATLFLFPILLGQLAILRVRRSARQIHGALMSSRCHMPMACGLFHRAIILPEDAHTWTAARREAVIRHESEHLRRCDCLWQQLGQFARALYWFNPLVWLLHHHMLCEAERACDDAVLTEGSKPSDYAEHLLAIATTGRSDLLLASAGVAMARASSLEGRLLSILDAARNRRAVTRRVIWVCMLLLLAVAVPLAMVRAQTPTTGAQADAGSSRNAPIDEATARTIRDAVETIATCTEIDPRVQQALNTLNGIPDDVISTGLVDYLKSDTDTMRRSAVYILFRGNLANIDPAVPVLLSLCKHQEDLTRGMAALALGQRHVAQGYKTLTDMAADASPYARRCAVYALGLLGNSEALPLLRGIAAGDPQAPVRQNAQAAITMLMNPATTRPGQVPPAAATPSTPTAPVSEGIRLELRKESSLVRWQVYTALPGSFPLFTWDVPADARDTTGYMGFIVTPVPRADVQNLPQQELWRALNDVDKMKWFVMGLRADTRSIRYAQAGAPEQDGVLTVGTAKSLTEGFYLVMVSGYQGHYRPQEGRQPIVSGGCVLKVGNPKEPPKPDFSKLTPEQMQAKVQEWVEDFFSGNYRDITARKAIEWGKAQKLDNGNWQIRYKYEATIWNKDKVIHDKLFTFTPEGGFVGVQDVPGRLPATAPRVLSTEPASRSKGVPATLKEIKVVFSSPMDTSGFSFVGAGPAFPKTTDKPRWIDDRTCVLPVQLEPGHDYWLQLNNSNFRNFRGKDGQPIEPYPVWFQTAGGNPPGPPVVAETSPKDETNDVDPSLTEIRVTFSQPMDSEGMSWVGADDFFHRLGKPRWIDDRTCVMPVKLLPNQTYRLSFNSSTFMGFCGKSGVPSLPSLLSFKTRAAAPAKPITAEDRSKADELAKEGWDLWQKQQFAPASERFAEAVKLNPNATNAWNGLGWALFNAGNAAEAHNAFASCVALAPNHPAALNGLGQIELQQGDLAQSEKHLLAAAPTSSAAWWGLAKLYLVQGKYDEAAKWTDRILKEDPGNADAKQLRAAAQEKRLPDELRDLKAKAQEQGKVNIIQPASPAADAGLPPLTRRDVNKPVSEFAQKVDLSTPESAWAAWQRANSRMDAQAVVDLSWVVIPLEDEKAFWERELARNPENVKIFTQAIAASKLLEVFLDRDELATTITYLAFPEGKGRDPYSIRVFGKIGGEWKNLGEDRSATLEEARTLPQIKRSGYWNQFQGIKAARGNAKTDASSTTTFEHVIAIELAKASFLEGDRIVIREIRGTAPTITPGNTYLITGAYTLKSHERATIGAFTTAADPSEGSGPIAKGQVASINKGEGAFTLTMPVTIRGQTHLSLYPVEGGGSFGEMYFNSPQGAK